MTEKLTRRAILFGATAAVGAHAVSASAAGSALRLRILRRGGQVTAETIVLRETQDRWIDISAWLDTIPAENNITSVATGDVQLRVWPVSDDDAYAEYSTDPSWYWVKRELYPFGHGAGMLMARTVGASVGSLIGTWSFSAYTGAGETGSLSTLVVNFDVVADPRFTTTDDPYPLGQDTRAGYGGFALSYLPGNIADKSITAQSTSGALAIFAQSNCVSWAGTYGSTTRTVGTPTVGDLAYWADITDSVLAQTWRVYFNVEYAVMNATTATGDARDSNQLVTCVQSTRYFGGRIIVNDAAFIGIRATITSVIGVHPTLGIPAPTQPYVEGWAPDDEMGTPNAGIRTADPGWFTICGLNPIGAVINTEQDVTGNGNFTCNATGNAFYTRFAGVRGVIYPQTTTGSAWSWLMMAHCEPFAGASSAGNNMAFNNKWDFQTAVFFNDNYCDGEGLSENGSVSICGRDSQLVGNVYTRQYGERFGHFLYDTTPGNNRSHASYNLVKNCYAAGEAHIDSFQPNLSSSAVATLYRALAPGSVVPWAAYRGNIMYLGAGNRVVGGLNDGKAYAGCSQPMFLQNSGSSTTRSDLTHTVSFSGNFVDDIMFWGFALMTLSDGSVVTNNQMGYAYSVLDGVLTGAGYYAAGPYQPGTSTGAIGNNLIGNTPGAGVTIKRNVRINGGPAYVWTNGENTTYADNWVPGYGITTQAHLDSIEAIYANPTIGPSAQTLKSIAEAFTPKPGTTPLTMAALPVGSFQPPGSYLIDVRRRTYSPNLLT